MGLFDTIILDPPLVIDGEKVEDLQTKWRLYAARRDSRVIIVADAYTSIERDGMSFFIDVFIELEPVQDWVRLPDYFSCSIRTLRLGDVAGGLRLKRVFDWGVTEVSANVSVPVSRVLEKGYKVEQFEPLGVIEATIELDVGRLILSSTERRDSFSTVSLLFRRPTRSLREAGDKLRKVVESLGGKIMGK